MSDLGDQPVDLLIVSDSELTRRAMEEHLCHRFSIETAESGAQALEFLGCQPASLVIVEYRMPELDGLEVIRRAREIRPDAVYLLLVDEADFDGAVRGQLDLVVDYFVRRPWDAHELCVNLQTAKAKNASRGVR